ncbi:oxygenase MpaB family protein [Streptomyces sp. ODS28]|uniref:oxygenase MpaB family protein n=1 Tax=Streptomyces sp. ODS28 TaxID=3136688 RepID=UPI0031E8FB4F
MSRPIETDPELAYRNLAMGELGGQLLMGMNIGFYRTFAIPSIARTLVAAGGLTDSPALRAKTTGDMMYGLIQHGLDSDRGKRIIAAINAMHAAWDISNHEFLYVLACFEIAPLRWCDAHGRRATTDAEKQATHAFYQALAKRMGIEAVPRSWEEFAVWMDEFEKQHYCYTPEAHRLWTSTREVLTNRAPRPLAPLVRMAADALLDEPLRRAVGASKPTALAHLLARLLLRLTVPPAVQR